MPDLPTLIDDASMRAARAICSTITPGRCTCSQAARPTCCESMERAAKSAFAVLGLGQADLVKLAAGGQVSVRRAREAASYA